MTYQPFNNPLLNIVWNEGTSTQLKEFLRDAIDTPLKVKILGFFFHNPGRCQPVFSLAQDISQPTLETLQAVRELDAAGILYCQAHFGFSQLCSLPLSRISAPVKADLTLLYFALVHHPTAISDHFKHGPEAQNSKQICVGFSSNYIRDEAIRSVGSRFQENI